MAQVSQRAYIILNARGTRIDARHGFVGLFMTAFALKWQAQLEVSKAIAFCCTCFYKTKYDQTVWDICIYIYIYMHMHIYIYIYIYGSIYDILVCQ